MKLRNKKTGEIREIKSIVIDGMFTVGSITDLTDNWEDYIPQEPLIKDEKIRKAVRAFSEAIQEKKHILVIKQCGLGIAEFSNGNRFWIRLPLSNETMDALEDRTYYTITELCGEEEDEE